MNARLVTGLDGRELRTGVRANREPEWVSMPARWRSIFGFVIAAGMLSPMAALAQTGTCRVTHIDYYERKALQAVEALIRTPYVLSQYPYAPVSSARRQPGQSEAARIAPSIVRQTPDVVVVHGSTFTGSADLRKDLGELIRNVDRGKDDIRGFVIYSSSPLDGATLSIDGKLGSKLHFMFAPIMNRFRPPDPSAQALSDHVERLCRS